MRKVLENIVLIIFSLCISAMFTLVIWGVFLGNLYASLFLGNIQSQGNYFVVLILSTYIPIIIPSVIFILISVLIMKTTKKFWCMIVRIVR